MKCVNEADTASLLLFSFIYAAVRGDLEANYQSFPTNYESQVIHKIIEQKLLYFIRK